jgi:hypothetical protein
MIKTDMKTSLISFLINCTIILSCSKTSDSINNDKLAGTWLLKQYAGGQLYQVIIPTDTVTVTFSRSGKFTSSANFSIPPNGSYTITNDVEEDYGGDKVVNLFANGWSKITYGIITLKEDSLILYDGCCDLFQYTYVRQ